MGRSKTTDEAVIERLRGEINVKRRQVQQALENGIEPGRCDSGSKLHQIFASFQGTSTVERAEA